MSNPPIRPRRDTLSYTEAELALFAAFRDQRASVRPLNCQGGEKCWVELGPPGASHWGRCRGCGGTARLLR